MCSSETVNQTNTPTYDILVLIVYQSELPRPIPQNSVESDHGCISRIYFDNAADNVMLTLYNMTLTSQKPCLHNNKCD